MARRLNARNDEETRARIQASQLINRLQRHVDGEVEMTQTQIRAAEILLNKSLPNLTASDVNLNNNVSLVDVLTALSDPAVSGDSDTAVAEESADLRH